MLPTGLGTALRSLRERRTLTVRELGQLAGVDHAYVHRLETGEKTSPSAEVLGKLLRVLKPTEREAEILVFLADHPDSDVDLVAYVLADATIGAQIFAAAAGVRYRGNARPDPATLIERVRRAFE
jgi:HTH-type transcriptional regulator, competence development regulator